MRPSAGDKDRRPVKSPAGGIRRGSSDLASGASLRGEVPTYSECCTPVCSSPDAQRGGTRAKLVSAGSDAELSPLSRVAGVWSGYSS